MQAEPSYTRQNHKKKILKKNNNNTKLSHENKVNSIHLQSPINSLKKKKESKLASYDIIAKQIE